MGNRKSQMVNESNQIEGEFDFGAGGNGHPVLHCRTEPDLPRRFNGSFIQAVSQAPHDADLSNRAIGPELN